VREAHHLHAWALTTGKNVVSLHALVDRGVERQALQRRIFEVLRDDFDVYFSTVQLETECLEREEARAIDATWATDETPATMTSVAAARGSGSVLTGPDRPSANGFYAPSR
jgi:cobalt-zinc-cadmium efflux system protein